jgi:hypothetical protein
MSQSSWHAGVDDYFVKPTIASGEARNATGVRTLI